MIRFGLYNQRKCKLLLCIIAILSKLFIVFSIMIVEKIKPLAELMFIKQFIIFGILFLIILPTLMIIIGNVYFNLTKKKDWTSWFKIPECYDKVFTIIAIYPFLYLIFEVGLLYVYLKLFKLNNTVIGITISITAGILFPLIQLIVRKIFRIK